MRKLPFSVLVVASAVAGALLLVSACGSDEGTASNVGPRGGAAGTAGTGTGGGAQEAGGASGSAGLDGSAGTTVNDAGPDVSAGGSSGSGGDAGTATKDVMFGYDAPAQDVTLNQDSACATVSAAATKLPVDIIFLIDNSGSMTQEIVSVQNNINDNFASMIGNSGIDYRVIMVSRHGTATSGQSICVKAPLSGTTCDPVPAQPVNNPPLFFHYSTEIASHNSWCKVLTTFNTADEFSLAPQGWSQWLRASAHKTFVMMTDDGVSCSGGGKSFNDTDTVAGGQSMAPSFDESLLALSPVQFGDATHRRYDWYSIVCLAANNPATNPWLPTDPMVAGKCSSSNCPAPGTGYQALSILTGGMRFPLCEYQAFDVVFKAIAQGVVSSLACQFSMPVPEAGVVDPAKVSLKYTPGSGPVEEWKSVSDEAACSGDTWYYDNNTNPSLIYLCPDACSKAKADSSATVEVLLGCLGS